MIHVPTLDDAVVGALLDAHRLARTQARDLAAATGEAMTLIGYGVAELRGPDGQLKQLEPFANLITDVGDGYYAAKMIQGISPANPGAPTAALGMKLGTGTTAAAKSGAGAALVTYKTGSNAAFDATYPQTANLGAGLGVNAVYRTTWAIGVATDAALTEAVLVTDSGANATSTSGNTYHRGVYTAVNKTAGDSFAIVWNVKALGA